MLINLISAATLLLAKVWKTPDLPFLREWKYNVYYIYLMSNLSAYCHFQQGDWKAMDKFNTQWQLYVNLVPLCCM